MAQISAALKAISVPDSPNFRFLIVRVWRFLIVRVASRHIHRLKSDAPHGSVERIDGGRDEAQPLAAERVFDGELVSDRKSVV